MPVFFMPGRFDIFNNINPRGYRIISEKNMFNTAIGITNQSFVGHFNK